MKVSYWRDLVRKLPSRTRARVAARVEAELLATDLRAIRASYKKKGGVSLEEMRRRHGPERKARRRRKAR